MRIRFAIVACAALMLAAGWWWWRPVATMDVPPVSGAPPSETSAAPGLDAPLAAGSTFPLDSSASSAERVPLPEPAVELASAAPESWWLVGTLLGWDPRSGPGAELEVERRGASPIRAAARADGSFAIDVTALCAPRSSAAGRSGIAAAARPENASAGEPEPEPEVDLEVRARHPEYLPVRSLIPSDVIAAARAKAVGSTGRDARIELRHDLRLRLAAAVAGSVLVEAPADVHGAEVSLLPDGARGAGWPISSSTCGPDGRYRLRAPSSGEYVVLAQRRGWRAAAVRVRLVEGATLELPDLVLEAGTAKIRGRLDVPADWDAAPVGEFEFVASARRIEVHASPWNRPRPAAEVLGATGGEILHAGNVDRFTEALSGGWPSRRQTAVVEGRDFELAGLDPGEWKLEIRGIPSSALLPMREPTIVLAPAGDVLIGRHLCRLVLRVTEEGRPRKDAEIRWLARGVDDGQVRATKTDERGEVVVIGDLAVDYTATVTRAGAQPVAVELPASGRPRSHVVEVELPFEAPAAVLTLRVPDGGSLHASLLVRLRRRAVESDSSGASSSATHFDRRCELRDGAYVADAIPPGSYAIEVGPSADRGPVAFYGNYLQTERFELDLAPGAHVERTLAWRAGGRLRVEVAGFEGGDAVVPCELVDAWGNQVPGAFVVAEEGDGGGLYRAQASRLSLRHPSAFQDCLEPGTYELRVSSGEHPIDPVRVEVRALETVTARLSARGR